MSLQLAPGRDTSAGPEDHECEEGLTLTPRFDGAGLLPAIVTDAVLRAVLMLAWMNAEAFDRTLATGEAWFWSRSGQRLWHKGATSGQIQHVEENPSRLRPGCRLADGPHARAVGVLPHRPSELLLPSRRRWPWWPSARP